LPAGRWCDWCAAGRALSGRCQAGSLPGLPNLSFSFSESYLSSFCFKLPAGFVGQSGKSSGTRPSPSLPECGGFLRVESREHVLEVIRMLLLFLEDLDEQAARGRII